MVLVCIVVITLFSTHKKPEIIETQKVPTDVKGMIVYYSEQYGASLPLLDKMADCESDFNPLAKGDGGKAHNVYQYHYARFIEDAKLMGETLDYNSAHDNIKLAVWISVHYPERMQAWTSYRAIKNGGVYSFYSRTLKKHYTVYCKL